MLHRLALRSVCVVGVLLGSLLAPGADAAEKWGPFRGRIVDVETGEPIPGAAILVVWYEAVHTLAQTNEKFFDAREAKADVEGRFEISRLSPPFFGFRIFPPGFTYFAPGYAAHSEIVTPPDGQAFVEPTVVRMRRLKTRQELWEKSRARPGGVPDEKMPGFIRAINVENRMLGLDPIGPRPERQP